MGKNAGPDTNDMLDAQLSSNVRPAGWVNPKPVARYNLVVLGAGTSGLVSAAGAAMLGAKVALVERNLLGGDCLNWGCVPSKAIIRSSRSAFDAREAGRFGVKIDGEINVDFSFVMQRMRALRSQISAHDAAARFQELGVDVYFGEASFAGPDSIRVGNDLLLFDRAVIATGARAVEPPIDGLSDAGFHTNETVFSITERPERLAVIGGGPLGSELAQAFHRLGSKVFLFQRSSHLLGRDDREAAEILQRVFASEGISLFFNSAIVSITRNGDEKHVIFEKGGERRSLAADAILVGAGRAPNVETLDLARAGVSYDSTGGVHVDDFLRTTNPRIYAAGDVCLRSKFTHMADATARIVIQNALFGGRKRLSSLTVPWVTYTDPEIAHVGLSEKESRDKGFHVRTYLKNLEDVDRAILDGETEGFVKIHTKRGTDRILGATIVARHAGEMINEISFAIGSGLGLRALSEVIHPYPTQAEALKGAALEFNRSRLTPSVRLLTSSWLRFRRSGTFRRIENCIRGARALFRQHGRREK
ncbi:MAG: mercuric reductase [Desulfobacteraceae bacterium]|nr:mercuric reductase [Desulfobacteraceae bacterium]